jgi:hypothetical protein
MPLLEGTLHPEDEKKWDQFYLCTQNLRAIKLRFEGILCWTRADWLYVQVAKLMKFNVGNLYTDLCSRLQSEQTAVLEQFTEFVFSFSVSYKSCSVRASVLFNPTIRFMFIYVSRDSSVGIAAGYGLDHRHSSPGGGKRFFSSTQSPYRLWGQPSLLYNVYGGCFPEV